METNEKLIKIVTKINRTINDFFRIYPSLDDDTKKFISSYYMGTMYSARCDIGDLSYRLKEREKLT